MEGYEESGEEVWWLENRGDNVFEKQPKVDRGWLSTVENPPSKKAMGLRQEQ